MIKLNKKYWTLLMGVVALFAFVVYLSLSTPMAVAVSQEQQYVLASDCSNPCDEQGIVNGCTSGKKGKCVAGDYVACPAGEQCYIDDNGVAQCGTVGD
jgi:hypothetical protein